MYEISSELYLEVAQQLAVRFGDEGYFSGSIELEHREAECHLCLSAVIYRERVQLPEGRTVERIADVVPVWWEFHTFINGVEVLNDFSFGEVRGYLRN